MRRTLLAILIAVAGATGLLAAEAPHASAAEGYGQSAATVYSLDPANGRLRVTVTIKVTNRTPDANEGYSCVQYTDGWFPIPYPATCYRVVHYYLTTTSAVVENEAAGLRAVSGGRVLTVTPGPAGAQSRSVTITFPELFYGRSRTVRLTYTIKGGGPRSESTTRAMRAYASFCAIANGVDGGTVTVRVPKGFKVSTIGATLRARVAGKERVFSSGAIGDPASWYACFTGANAGGYRTQQLAVPQGGTIHLRSWPEDPAWARSVGAGVSASLPLLERLTGTTMATAGSLKVQEAPAGAGYTGSYDQASNTVTVGEDFGQPALVEHEVAHVWFNRAVLKETWLSEGFAEWAGRAVAGEGACGRPDAPAGSVSLADWRYLAPQASAEERAAVDRQYQAACYVVTAVAAAAGPDRMTAAISALLGRRDPYAADPAERRASKVATWRDWLDAVNELALAPSGADGTLASDLLVAYGAASDRALLADRATARQAYHELAAATDGWVVPAAVRAPLAAWNFRGAGAAIEAARRTWELTGETDAVLAGVDARHGPAADAWERAGSLGDLEAAADLAGRQLGAARDVAEVRALVGQPLDIAQQVGLFGTQVPSVDAAIPAVRAGDGDAVAGITARIRATVAGLRATGQQRMAAGGGVALALLAVLAVMMVRRTRLASRRRAEARLAAATVAVVEAHAWPGDPAGATRGSSALGSSTARGSAVAPAEPWGPNPLDDSPTKVWNVPLVSSDPDPDLGALVHKAPYPPATPPSAPGP